MKYSGQGQDARVKRDAVLNFFGKWTEKVLKWRRQEERSRHGRMA